MNVGRVPWLQGWRARASHDPAAVDRIPCPPPGGRAPHATPPHPVRPAWRRILVVAAVLLAACSATSRYEVLSFFFDGVPNPDAPPPAAPEAPKPKVLEPRRSSTPPLVMHEPFAQRRCSDCHLERKNAGERIGSSAFRLQDLTALRLPVQELCVSCHAQPARQFDHAPALLGECTTCHHPHASAQAHLLLRQRTRDLCILCHRVETMGDPSHLDQSADHDCAECHDPHGGDQRYFLRSPQRAASPATAPTVAPAVPPTPGRGGDGGNDDGKGRE